MRALVLALALAAASPAAASDVCGSDLERGASVAPFALPSAPAHPTGSMVDLPLASQATFVRVAYAPSDAPSAPPLRARDSRSAIRRANKGAHVPRMGTDEPPSR